MGDWLHLNISCAFTGEFRSLVFVILSLLFIFSTSSRKGQPLIPMIWGYLGYLTKLCSGCDPSRIHVLLHEQET